jgi:uncharacterized protein (TIGR00730 family)
MNNDKPQRPPKAYRNLDFLNSPHARTIRILAEYHEPRARFEKYGVENSIVFFGSARSQDLSQSDSKDLDTYAVKLSHYYQQAVELSKKLTEWSFRPGSKDQSYYICSGGGPGMMEAANKGATLAGGKSIGLNISIPMEQYPNPYITEELMFEFHYFFVRKFWFVYLAKALVIFPGGFGTLDELMEVLTLIQTEKLGKKLPIVLFGKEFWNEVIDFQALIKWGTISKDDLDLMYFSDGVDDAFNYLITYIKPNGS